MLDFLSPYTWDAIFFPISKKRKEEAKVGQEVSFLVLKRMTMCGSWSLRYPDKFPSYILLEKVEDGGTSILAAAH